MTRALPLLLLLAACAETPALDARIPPAERMAPPPPLAPLGPVLVAAGALPATPDDGGLSTRAEALAARARAIPAPDPAAEAERLAALRARAEALREGASLP